MADAVPGTTISGSAPSEIAPGAISVSAVPVEGSARAGLNKKGPEIRTVEQSALRACLAQNPEWSFRGEIILFSSRLSVQNRSKYFVILVKFLRSCKSVGRMRECHILSSELIFPSNS